MMKVPAFINALVVGCLVAVSAAAQQPNDQPLSFPAHVEVPGADKSDYQRYLDMVRKKAAASSNSRRTEPRVLKKGPLAPSVHDRDSYATFLKQRDTGLIRLLPQSFKDGKRQPERYPEIWGGGRFFSFSNISHKYGAELELAAEINCQSRLNSPPDCQYPRKLKAGSYGMLTNLGKQTLAKFDLNDPRANFMQGYKPPRSAPQARCEGLEFRKGVTIEGHFYRNGLPVEVGATYLLRAFDYGQSDVLVIFEVAREESDGSVTIAWRLLKRFTPLKLENVVYVNKPTDKCPTR